jgi:hypothetical protein
MVAQFVVFYVLHVYRQQFDFFSKCKFVAKPQAVGRNQFFSVNLFRQIFIIISHLNLGLHIQKLFVDDLERWPCILIPFSPRNIVCP